VSMRVSRNFTFGPQRSPTGGGRGAGGQNGGGRANGGPAEGAPAGGNFPAGAAPQFGQGGPGGPGGPGGGGGGNPFANNSGRFSAEVWISANNVFNRVNYLNYVGTLRSPFFGTATSSAPARRVEIGMNFRF